MKKIVTIFAILTLTISASCGSSSAPGDTAPVETKVLALGGALSAFVNQWASVGGTIMMAGSGSPSPIEYNDTFNNLNMGLEGDSQDIIDFESVFTTSGTTTITATITSCDYLSTMVEYPINAGETLAGATITFDETDYVVDISVADNASEGDTSGEITLTNEDPPTPLSTTLAGNSSATLVSMNITSPEAKIGTATFSNAIITSEIIDSEFYLHFIGTVTVGYGGDTYSCPVLASYTGPDEGAPGNTGVGTLSVTSASCTEQ